MRGLPVPHLHQGLWSNWAGQALPKSVMLHTPNDVNRKEKGENRKALATRGRRTRDEHSLPKKGYASGLSKKNRKFLD